MPGVIVTTETVAGPATSQTAPAATFFVAGLAHRGPTDEAVLVRSLADFERRFGPRVTYGSLHDQLATFFGEGGSRAYVARVVGDAATLGTVTLQDQAGVPVDTLRIDALGAGAWSDDLQVRIADGLTAGTFDLTVVLAGADVESYIGLDSPAAAANALEQSVYVRATDLGAATVAPDNNPAAGTFDLSAGTDDRASIVTQDYIDQVDGLFTYDLGAGAVAVPGQTAANVGADLIAHGKANRRLVLLAPAPGSTLSAAKAAAAAVRDGTDDEYAGVFWPAVLVPAGGGRTRTITPEGYIAGVRARAHMAEGPWRAPAGEAATARYIVGTDVEVPQADGDEADAAGVSAIRRIANTLRLYGWRSLSTDLDNYALLTGRDVLNFAVAELERRLEPLVFRTIDGKGHLFAEAAGIGIGLAEPMRAAGGLYELVDDDGNAIDPGYAVETGPSVNTPDTIQAGKIKMRVALRVSPTGTLVEVTVAKVAVNAAL